jgi:hypothetical protein
MTKLDVSDQAKCIGAAAICTHGGDHPCRECHVKAWAVLVAVIGQILCGPAPERMGP